MLNFDKNISPSVPYRVGQTFHELFADKLGKKKWSSWKKKVLIGNRCRRGGGGLIYDDVAFIRQGARIHKCLLGARKRISTVWIPRWCPTYKGIPYSARISDKGDAFVLGHRHFGIWLGMRVMKRPCTLPPRVIPLPAIGIRWSNDFLPFWHSNISWGIRHACPVHIIQTHRTTPL